MWFELSECLSLSLGEWVRMGLMTPMPVPNQDKVRGDHFHQKKKSYKEKIYK